jgi:ethanolamine utilization protein EutN
LYIGRVSGTVVATFKDKVFEGRKLLVVDRLTPEGELTGHYWIAVDDVQAGVGDTVMVIDEGNSARQVVGMDPAPIRAVVVGIVDEIDIARSSKFKVQSSNNE